MLPDLRFVIGAVLATALLVVTAFGVAATLRLAQQAKVGPLESSRSLAYADQTDWNQFQDPNAARRFEDMARPIDSESVHPSLEPASPATSVLQPAAPSAILETPAPDTAGDAPESSLIAGVAQDANVTSNVPLDGNATPVADDHATQADLEPVIVPAPAAATSAPLPEAADAAKPGETPAIEVAAVDPPVAAPTTEPVIAAPAPLAEPPAASVVDRVASIPAISPGQITAVEPLPPLPRAAPARRQLATAATQAKRAIHRSRLIAARARANRAARARIARAQPAAQQPYASTGYTATTAQPNNQINNRQFNTTGFNNARPASAPRSN